MNIYLGKESSFAKENYHIYDWLGANREDERGSKGLNFGLRIGFPLTSIHQSNIMVVTRGVKKCPTLIK